MLFDDPNAADQFFNVRNAVKYWDISGEIYYNGLPDCYEAAAGSVE